MPSYEAACDLYRGDPDALSIIGAALGLAGERDLRTLTKYALAGSLGVEAFVLGWVWRYGPKN
jgi:hypothetical protein